MTTRRGVLAGVLAAASGGCLALFEDPVRKRLELTPVSAAEVAARFSLSTDELGPDARGVVTDGIPNGTTRYGYRPLDDGSVVAVNGTYYAATVTDGGPEDVTRPVLRAERVDSPSGTVGTLTGTDAAVVDCTVGTAEGETGLLPCVLFDGEEGAFLPEMAVESVQRDGAYYDLSVVRETVTLRRYDFEFEAIGSAPTAFLEVVEETRLTANFDREPPPPAQREILRTAADDGHYRSSAPPSAAFDRLAARLETEGVAILRFDGGYYRAVVSTVRA